MNDIRARVIEMVVFNTVPGADEEAFLNTSASAGMTLSRFPGFLGRRLVRNPQGGWTDIVEWTDMSSAKKAAEVFMTLPEIKPFCALIDIASVIMNHHEVVAVN